MTRRAVVFADIRGRVARLVPIDNGSGYVLADVVALARAAALEPRVSNGAALLSLRSLPDFEAMAELKRVVVIRRARRS
jgi:hypothetical protein